MDGRLTESQRAKLEKHPLQSASIMENAGFMDPLMIKAIRQHHERPDCSGYPNRLPGAEISDLALVVSMCEVYTARIDNRVYRKPVLAREALAQFRDAEDPRIKDLLLGFAKAIGIYPPGTWVKLTSGETAIVVKRLKNSPIPVVRALFDMNDIPYMGPVKRDAKTAEFKVIGATTPTARPSVDLSALFDFD
jgi:HD-GYP domain-containing protein (c-di-GMP phosphodiesterase class II)